MKIIVYIQSSEGKINPISLESLVAAQKLKENKGAEIYAATFSDDIANQLTTYDVNGVLHINNENLLAYSPLHYIEMIGTQAHVTLFTTFYNKWILSFTSDICRKKSKNPCSYDFFSCAVY